MKGRFLTHCQPDFQLFETILWQPDSGYWLLEQHLQRLVSAAQFFTFSCDLATVRTRLSLEAAGFDENCYRVRLVLKKDGRVFLSAVPCDAPVLTSLPSSPVQDDEADYALVDFSPHKIDTESPWCYHKTTMRELYDSEYKRAQKDGLFDLLFCNERGEVSEGCITNIIIYSNGKFRTPSLASGLLPGIMRGHLLTESAVPLVEEVLTEQMVRSAEAIWLCNSVRGLVRVKLRSPQ